MTLTRSVLALVVFACASVPAFACSSSSSSPSSASGRTTPGSDAVPPEPPRQSDVVDAAAAAAEGSAREDASTDAPAPAVVGTGGTGGLPCTRMDDLGAGRQSCVAKVGSVELKIVMGQSSAANKDAPLRLGLYLHGDGAQYHSNNAVLEAMLPWADAHHGLAVSALAPNGCAWWLSPAYDCSGAGSPFDSANENSAALATAVNAIKAAYDIRTDEMRYYSASGGSIFLTHQWFPLQAGNHPGVLAILCGGVVPGVPYAWDTSDAALRARNRTWLTYGDGDGLRPQIEQTAAAFSGKGLGVTTKIIPNQGHCTFDVHGEAMAIWSANP